MWSIASFLPFPPLLSSPITWTLSSTVVLALVQCGMLLPLSLVRWCCCNFFALPSGVSLGPNGIDQPMAHGSWVVLEQLSAGVRCCVDHYGFDAFVVGCAFDSAHTYLACLHSEGLTGREWMMCPVGSVLLCRQSCTRLGWCSCSIAEARCGRCTWCG